MHHCICLLLNMFPCIDVKIQENCLITLETNNPHVPKWQSAAKFIVTNLIQFSEIIHFNVLSCQCQCILKKWSIYWQTNLPNVPWLKSKCIFVQHEKNFTPRITRFFPLLLKAVGCPDITLPTNAKSSLKGDILTIVCNNTRENFQLKCLGNEWLGQIPNCSTSKLCFRKSYYFGNNWMFPKLNSLKNRHLYIL